MIDRYDDDDTPTSEQKITGNIKKIPSHPIAVALRDMADEGLLPRITASGRGAVAGKILDIAFEHGIRVREDADLADLLAQIDLDSEIPSEAMIAVAEILAYVYQANGQENPFDTIIKDSFEDNSAAKPIQDVDMDSVLDNDEEPDNKK